MIISLAFRFTSFRRAASITMRRNSPVNSRVSPFWDRSTVCPKRSRPSRRLPSHLLASSLASCAPIRSCVPSPSGKKWAVVLLPRLSPFQGRTACRLSGFAATDGDRFTGPLDICSALSALSARWTFDSLSPSQVAVFLCIPAIPGLFRHWTSVHSGAAGLAFSLAVAQCVSGCPGGRTSPATHLPTSPDKNTTQTHSPNVLLANPPNCAM